MFVSEIIHQQITLKLTNNLTKPSNDFIQQEETLMYSTVCQMCVCVMKYNNIKCLSNIQPLIKIQKVCVLNRSVEC